jgi:hypothetical protein
LSNPSSDSADIQDRVKLALRLGWTIAEVYGRLLQNPLPPTPSTTTRLFVSKRNPDPYERLWAATQRLAVLCEALFEPSKPAAQEPEQDSAARGGASPKKDDDKASAKAEADRRPAQIEYPACMDELARCLEQRLASGRAKLPHAQALYGELDQWSRKVWVTLDAEDPLLSEALTLGARLADTFWQWPYPGSGPAQPLPEQTWRYLLKPERLNRLIRQVRRVEAYLPEHVGPMLRHSLWEWEIGGQPVHASAGQLAIAYPGLYRWRSLGWARTRRQRQTKANPRLFPQLTPEEEKKLLAPVWRRLHKQMETWESLVFDRSVSYLLRPSDWRGVRWLTFGLYALLVILIVAGIAVSFLYMARIGGQILIDLFPFLAEPKEFKDQLALVTTLGAVLAFLATQFWRGLRWLQGLYAWAYQWVMMRKLEQRSLYPWNGGQKRFISVCLQRLLRVESGGGEEEG